MAKTVINLSDQVSTWLSKTNTISDHLGDIVTLTSGDSNVVDAINAILADPGIDSVGILALFSVNNTNGGGIVLSYNSSTGVIGVTSQIVSSSTISYDSANANFSLIDSSVTLSKIAADAVSSVGLKDVVSLRIFDASGTVVKTIYGAGS